MIIGILKETREGEHRVAATPESVKKLIGLGADVILEKDAGAKSSYPNEQYEAAGVKIVDRGEAAGADVVLKVACPQENEVAEMKEGALLISLLDPFGGRQKLMDVLAEKKVDAIGMELIPRITRAQSMDVLSSQANLAGYKAVVEAAHEFEKLFPMMMTAAGSVPPATCIVLGVGVAGLQAIATAKRLGARVEAFDVRPEVKEQVLSVGAKWLDLGIDESGAGEGGYAKELSEEGKKKQKEALTRELARADIVITTALIPGRPAPELVTEEAVKSMKPGSVIFDMAAANGGNCKLSEPDKVVQKHGVTIIGYTNLPSMVSNHASQFYARNLMNLLQIIIQKEDGGEAKAVLNLEDEIIDKALTTQNGERRWPPKKD